MSLADIKTAAADLDEGDRAALASWLLESLPPPFPTDEADDIIDEADRRRQQLREGKTVALSSDEFWKTIDSESAECE